MPGASPSAFSFHPPSPATSPAHPAGEKEEATSRKIVITDIRPISDPELLAYLESRYIPVEIAALHCREVDFTLYGNRRTVIGFPNSAGGYELRSRNFKGSSSPKSPTFLENGHTEVSVFEGFFDFLSYLTVKESVAVASNFLILNSLSFFHRSKEFMEGHQRVDLYLDRNEPGMACIKEALLWDKKKYVDNTHLYAHHQDLNEWLIADKRSFLLRKRLTDQNNQNKKGRRI